MTPSLALITGGTSGIGLGIAKKLGAQHNLALVYANNDNRAKESQALLQNLFPDKKILLFKKNLSSHDDAKLLFEEVIGQFQNAPSILIHSAGRLRDGLFLGSDFKEHQDLINEHLLVAMALSHVFLKAMYTYRFGRIIHLSSISANFAKRGQSHYAAAKAGLEGFTRTLALEVAHRGITVNAIAPGLIETPMTENFVKKLEESETPLRKRIPVGRMGTAEEVGALAAFLCSPEASYITGTVITIDGGRSLGDPQS